MMKLKNEDQEYRRKREIDEALQRNEEGVKGDENGGDKCKREEKQDEIEDKEVKDPHVSPRGGH